MKDRRQLTITVFDHAQYEIEDWPKENALDYLAWFAAKIQSIPEEFRPSAKIVLDAYESYGDADPQIKITYTRQETDAEVATREAEEERVRQSQIARERATYERLREKFSEPAPSGDEDPVQ